MKIAFISDIHEDLPSLSEALLLIQRLGCEQVVCLGDVCGFSVPHYTYLNERNASACVHLVQHHCQHAVVGNHDLFALRKTPSYSPLFKYPDNWYQRSFEERKQLSQDKLWLYEDNELSALLANNAYVYLDQLPELITLPVSPEHKLLLSHYVAPDLTGSMTGFCSNAYEFSSHLQLMKEQHCTLSVSGHTHKPGLTVLKKQQLLSIPFLQAIPLSDIAWVGIPPVSRSKTTNGFAVLDKQTQSITAIPIKKYRRNRPCLRLILRHTRSYD